MLDNPSEGFPWDKVDAAKRYLVTIKPWWSRFLEKFIIVPVEVLPEADGILPYGSTTATDRDFRLYVDRAFALAAPLHFLSGSLEHEMQRHMRDTWQRFKFLKNEAWRKEAVPALDLEINSAIDREQRSMTMDDIHNVCNDSALFTVRDLGYWHVTAPPGLDDDAWIPRVLGMEDGLSAEGYHEIIKELEENFPAPAAGDDAEQADTSTDEGDEEDVDSEEQESSDNSDGSNLEESEDEEEGENGDEGGLNHKASGEGDGNESDENNEGDPSEDGLEDPDNESSDDSEGGGEEGSNEEERGSDNSESQGTGDSNDNTNSDPDESGRGDAEEGSESGKGEGADNSDSEGFDESSEPNEDDSDSEGGGEDANPDNAESQDSSEGSETSGEQSQSNDGGSQFGSDSSPSDKQGDPTQMSEEQQAATIREFRNSEIGRMWQNSIENPNDPIDHPAWKPDTNIEEYDQPDRLSQGEISEAFAALSEDIAENEDYLSEFYPPSSFGDGTGNQLMMWRDQYRKSRGLNWDRQFNRIANALLSSTQIKGQSDLSYSVRNPNQQQVGPILQGLLSYAPTVYILQDVSGSMYLGKMARSMSVFTDLAHKVTSRFGDKVTWFTADTELIDVGKASKWDENVRQAFSYGFGGTQDFGTVIEQLLLGKLTFKGKRYKKPDLLIVSTDCCFPWVEKRPRTQAKLLVVNVGSPEDAETWLPDWIDRKRELVQVD